MINKSPYFSGDDSKCRQTELEADINGKYMNIFLQEENTGTGSYKWKIHEHIPTSGKHTDKFKINLYLCGLSRLYDKHLSGPNDGT